MKVLVTGGAGFIGGHIALYLKDRGYDVVALDNLEGASMVGVIEKAGIPLVIEDLRISGELPGADVIVHAAAYIDVPKSFSEPYNYIVNNAAVTAKIAKMGYERGSHVIYLSSAAVYGEPIYIPIDEKHPVNPLSPYGLSKWMGEEAISFYGRLGLKYTILRPFNVYGPCQSRAYSNVVSNFVERAKKGLPPIVYGDGEQVRDFINVRDVASFVEIVINSGSIGTFNVGTGRGVSINSLARLVLSLAGISADPIYVPPRVGDIRVSVADIRKALELGWTPKVEIRDGLRELLESGSCLN